MSDKQIDKQIEQEMHVWEQAHAWLRHTNETVPASKLSEKLLQSGDNTAELLGIVKSEALLKREIANATRAQPSINPNFDQLLARIDAQHNHQMHKVPSAAWRSIVGHVLQGLQHFMRQPISKSVSALTIATSVSVAFADEINPALYRTLNAQSLPVDIVRVVSEPQAHIFQLQFSNKPTPNELESVLDAFQLRTLAPITSSNKILVIKNSPWTETEKASITSTGIIESVQPIRLD